MSKEILVMDKNFNAHYILDTYESFIWTDRYSTYGDFEIYLPMSLDLNDNIPQEYYLSSSGSDRIMIVEELQIKSDVEEGSKAIIRGRSLESILERRIVWKQTILDGYLQGQVEKLINQNIISPEDSNRKIPNFVFKNSEDSRITSLKIKAQFTGDTIYDAVKSICDSVGLGFKVTLSDDFKFVFELFCGQDRSYDQTSNPFVIFSPAFENIVDSAYIESKKTLRTIALVAGENEGSDRKTYVVGNGSITGLNRRELFVDARDISSTTESGTLTATEYNSLLEQRGREKLAENIVTSSFDGRAETNMMFRYNEDFYIGDIVQIENEYGFTERVRVVEFIQSESLSGSDDYPTFETVN